MVRRRPPPPGVGRARAPPARQAVRRPRRDPGGRGSAQSPPRLHPPRRGSTEGARRRPAPGRPPNLRQRRCWCRRASSAMGWARVLAPLRRVAAPRGECSQAAYMVPRVDNVDLAFAGLARQAELIRAGDVTSRELVELYLERIERLDPQINAFRVVMAERALADAAQADARRRSDDDRPLLGVPIALKDNVDVAGEVTTHGTSAHGGPAREDAEIVKRLRAAGAVVLGKTLLPELAVYPWTESAPFGATRNPWDLNTTTGGSSGGSAAAVAGGLAAGGMASDGGGSIRVPAACCGLFGLKPQRGRVSLMPDSEHWHGLSVFGSVTRSVADSALWLDVVSGRADGDMEAARPPATTFAQAAATAPAKLRIAVSTKSGPPPVKVRPEVKQAVEQTAELLRSLGHEVERRDPDYGFVTPLFLPRWLRGIHDDATRLPHPERLERRVRRLVA